MKANGHKKLTEKTITIFHQYVNNEFSSLLKNNIKKIIMGSKDEDSWPIYTRITNWHFYRQNNLLKPTTVYYGWFIPLPVTPTSEKILSYRLDKVLNSLPEISSDFFEQLGRILHHVQDMNTPAHVVPVYHGPGLHDSFEDYSSSRPKDDKKKRRIIEIELENITITPEEFDIWLNQDNDDIMTIYQKAAEDTLQHLYFDNEAQFKLKTSSEYSGWKLFWMLMEHGLADCGAQPFDDINGFGCYGPLGNQYGETTVSLNETLYEVEPNTYRKLHCWVLHQQIVNSLKSLITIQKLFSTATN